MIILLSSCLYISTLINSINFIMEPTFAEISGEMVTLELVAQIAAAVNAIPPAHGLNPVELEHSESKEAAFLRL